ncbi:GntR family transcriptional regulator [Aerococcaceae bacterium zg-ZJ1578]|uniref:GntR family transcriptional regulator n=1 Tax=Aerococcaceae TaxID=186827 RepID=UPI0013BD4F1F|nr:MULTISPECIES: GntR family transcriptional regulator [unclassified Facklamia]MBK0347284.1 GntR family transcriptional regulator [Aerococcaceae bacterium zg-1578]MBR7927744.1 GntR family transcriptional regulator [Aerococcaceae bacterium zg-ZUI334]MBS4462083.1 GntR family transcriptional regulator [Aerococcaceae bacterium zg-B36]QQD65729.1 GntR family transcriptional regulator [Aerococcaceae bacterium zg-252]NEW64547.1 GntR family transcriptional regulator [Facklamia sp. 252]
MQFDFQGNVPLFQQVAEQIEQAILSGSFPEGEQIPSTTEVSISYQINPATVLKGMNLLVDQGILEKRRGLGTFVTQGAQAMLRKKRQQQFIDSNLPAFIKEAKTLGISAQSLVELIEKGY